MGALAKKTLALTVAALSAFCLTRCASLSGLNPSPVDSGAPMPVSDSSAATDGADTSSPVVMEAATPAPDGSYCAAVDATFCSDFDEPPFIVGWSGQEVVGAALVGKTGVSFFSPPNSLVSLLVMADGGVARPQTAALSKTLSPLPATLHVQTQFRLVSLGSTGSCTVLVVQSGSWSAALTTAITATSSGFVLSVNGQGLTRYLAFDKWHLFDFDVTLPADGGASGTVNFQAVGEAGTVITASVSGTVGEAITTIVGNSCASEFHTNFDNVVLQAGD